MPMCRHHDLQDRCHGFPRGQKMPTFLRLKSDSNPGLWLRQEKAGQPGPDDGHRPAGASSALDSGWLRAASRVKLTVLLKKDPDSERPPPRSAHRGPVFRQYSNLQTGRGCKSPTTRLRVRNIPLCSPW